MHSLLRRSILLFALGVLACGDDPEPRTNDDGGTADSSIRTDGRVTPPDAGDAAPPTPDAEADAAVDADVDAEVDADADVDAQVDAAADAGPDCSTAVDGEPCAAEGTFCGGPCTDVCSFCNILRCEGGRWGRLEVFPAPCFECGDKRCQQNEQLCRISHSDIGGEPDSYTCEETPEACVRETTCECLEANGVGSDRCTDDVPGQVTVEWFGG